MILYRLGIAAFMLPVLAAYQAGMMAPAQLAFCAGMALALMAGVPGWLLAVGAVGFVAARQTGALSQNGAGLDPASVPVLDLTVPGVAIGALVLVVWRAPQYLPALIGVAAVGLAVFTLNPDGVMTWTPSST